MVRENVLYLLISCYLKNKHRHIKMLRKYENSQVECRAAWSLPFVPNRVPKRTHLGIKRTNIINPNHLIYVSYNLVQCGRMFWNLYIRWVVLYSLINKRWFFFIFASHNKSRCHVCNVCIVFFILHTRLFQWYANSVVFQELGKKKYHIVVIFF